MALKKQEHWKVLEKIRRTMGVSRNMARAIYNKSGELKISHELAYELLKQNNKFKETK